MPRASQGQLALQAVWALLEALADLVQQEPLDRLDKQGKME